MGVQTEGNERLAMVYLCALYAHCASFSASLDGVLTAYNPIVNLGLQLDVWCDCSMSSHERSKQDILHN